MGKIDELAKQANSKGKKASTSMKDAVNSTEKIREWVRAILFGAARWPVALIRIAFISGI